MDDTRIIIIGGGVSGLYAAFMLEQQGISDYRLLEARSVPGGRIDSRSVSKNNADDDQDCFDLGPTWFWPAQQPELGRLVGDLNLKQFEQYEAGDMLVERSPDQAPLRVRGEVAAPRSMRLPGGMAALVSALQRELPQQRLLFDQRVQGLRFANQRIEVDAVDSQGRNSTCRAGRALLAIPPRLAVSALDFTPTLPEALAREWAGTATWMAPHAKYVAIYDMPFWRDRGLSGEARSAAGPLAEIHDASVPGGSAGLFGFFGIPAGLRSRVPEEVLRAQCRAQLVRLFGPQAARTKAEFFKDWAADPLTATPADRDPHAGHGAVPRAAATTGAWAGCLVGIASEWSTTYPGYVAGAIEAARLGVRSITGDAR